MLRWFLTLLCVTCGLPNTYADENRTIFMDEKEVVIINTKIGFSTKLVFSSRPRPGLVGDQDAYSVEYLNKIVSIKPLIPGSQTNLFVPTKEGHFNFLLKQGGKKHDNLIYIQKKGVEKSLDDRLEATKLYSKSLRKVAICGPVRLKLNKLLWPASRSTWVVDFTLEPRIAPHLLKNPIVFQVDDFELSQGKKKINIEGLYVDRASISSTSHRIIGKLHIRQEDVNRKRILELKIKSKNLASKKCQSLSMSIRLPRSHLSGG